MEGTSLVENVSKWPARTRDYFNELKLEMRRVTWPSRKQVEGTTLVVILTVFGFAAYFGAVDFFLNWAADCWGYMENDRVFSEDSVPEERMEAEGPAAETEEEHAERTGEVPPAEGYDASSPKKWFIIHTYSGFENKVAESLRSRAEAFGFADKIGQVLIPTEEVVELRNGKKVTSKRLVYPGYVLVEMEMNRDTDEARQEADKLWHEVKATPRVTGFVGGGTHPIPLSADEVNSILYRQASSTERPRPKTTYERNDGVRIVDGPFANFRGKVDEVNTDRGTLRVMVMIFGRATPVELEFLQVEKE